MYHCLVDNLLYSVVELIFLEVGLHTAITLALDIAE
jgi:hypothetical protein